MVCIVLFIKERKMEVLVKTAGSKIAAVLFAVISVFVLLGIYTDDVSAATVDETNKIFYGEGQSISISAVTADDGEEAAGKDIRVEAYDDETDSYETYFLTDDYTIYGGGIDVSGSAQIHMYSGEVHKIVAGGSTGNIEESAFVNIYGGTVGVIQLIENGSIDYASVNIEQTDDEIASVVSEIIVGSALEESGSISSIRISSEISSEITLTEGYCNGVTLSEAAENDDVYQIEIYGSNFGGLDSFKTIENCMINDKVWVYVDANGGSFSDGSTEKLVEIDPEDPENACNVEKPKLTGRAFLGWSPYEYWDPDCDDIYFDLSVVDRAYAIWINEDNTQLYNVNVSYTKINDEETSFDRGVNFYDDDYDEIWLPFNYDPDSIYIKGIYPNGERFSIPVVIGEDKEESVKLTATSANGTSKTYTIIFYVDSEPTEPYDMTVQYGIMEEGDILTDGIGFEFEEDENYAEVIIPYDYAKDQPVSITGYQHDGTEINLPVNISGNEGIVTFTAEKDGENTVFTVKVVVAEIDSNTGCEFNVEAWNGSAYYESEDPEDRTKNTIGVDITEDDIKAAMTAEGATIVLPYGTITETENQGQNNEILFNANPIGVNAKVDGKDSIYEELITPAEDGTVSKTVTVTAQNGDSQIYKFNFVEDEGNKTALDYLEFEVWNGKYNDYEEGEKDLTYIEVNTESAMAGCDVTIPYYYNADYGIVPHHSMYDAYYTVEDIEKTYYLDKDKVTVKFTVVSANGKKKQGYTINLIRDDEGTSTGFEYLNFMMMYEGIMEGGPKCEPINVSEAAGENGTTVFVPSDFIFSDTMFWGISGCAENYGTIEYTATGYDGESYDYKGRNIYYSVDLSDRDSETLKLTVVSANGEKTQDYIITFVKSDCINHEFGEWETVDEATCTEDGLKVRECQFCEAQETEKIPAAGHKWSSSYTVDVKATYAAAGSKSKHCKICDVINTGSKVAIPKLKCTLPAPKTLTATLYGYNDVKLTWSKVTGASGYAVYYKQSTASGYKFLKRTTSLSATKENLTDGKKYYFKVVPYVKENGQFYNSSKSKTQPTYTLKKVVMSSAKAYSKGKVKVTWYNIAGETGYQISKSTSKTGTNIVYTYKTTTGKSKVLTAKKGKGYYYKVRAYKTVKLNGVYKKIYGPWSAVKYCKAK